MYQRGFSNQNSDQSHPVTRVADINPFNANNLTLVLKVDNKAAVRTYNNAKGEGKMFSVDLVDDSGEIKCTFFNEAVDQYDPIFEVGKVFRITRAGIKQANPKFCRTQFEMTINKGTMIQEEQGFGGPLKRRYNFVQSIDAIQDINPNTIIDVIGVVYEVGDTANLNSKDGKELVKRTVKLADDSNRNVDFVLWGEPALNFNAQVGSILAVKNGRVGEYRGDKNFTHVHSTLVEIDPDIEEARRLAVWYDQNKDNLQTSSFSIGGGNSQAPTRSNNNKIETIAYLQEMAASGDKKAVFVKVKGTIIWINHDDRAPLYYKSCSDNNKKVVENTTNKGNGKKWVCEATGNYYDDYNLRYILTVVVGDTTGSQFVTIFNDHGEMILGRSAKEIEEHKENGDTLAVNHIFEAALFKRYLVTIKATEEMYQDEMKLRCVVQGLEKLDYVAESKRLLDEIHMFL